MGRPKKKIILCLVEGSTDIRVLNVPIRHLLEIEGEKDIEVCFQEPIINGKTGGDIMSYIDYQNRNIFERITDFYIIPFLSSANNQVIYLNEIKKIIHIIDIDGVFCPDNAVFQSDTVDPIYTDEGIYTKNVLSIQKRNQQKRDNIIKLLNKEKLYIVLEKNNSKGRHIDYSIFFFSSNMDHFIHGSANLSREEKKVLSENIAVTYNKDVNAFYRMITEDPGACRNMTYQESWDYIMQKNEMHSIQRHTNLNVLIEQYQ